MGSGFGRGLSRFCGFRRLAGAAFDDCDGGADVPSGDFEVGGEADRFDASLPESAKAGDAFDGAVEAFDSVPVGVFFYKFLGLFVFSSSAKCFAGAGSGFAGGGGD